MAKDSRKKLYNVEIQRNSDKAPPERARIHAAAVDWNNLDRGSEFTDAPETWIIFITDDDKITRGRPYLTVKRYFSETRKLFDDKLYIRYVSANFMGSGKFGKLMSDLRESDPEKTSHSSLADRVWNAKFTPKGVERMSYALDGNGQWI